MLPIHCVRCFTLAHASRAQLTEVVHGYTGPCDVAAREGLASLRERSAASGLRSITSYIWPSSLIDAALLSMPVLSRLGAAMKKSPIVKRSIVIAGCKTV